MDCRALVDEKAPSTKTGLVEQAIFTSIRSPMGQGYRIVAASAGISGDEKKEIVQSAPSHGNLCDPSPTAVGLASFALRSGRRCIFLSSNAGVEPTARGGYRIFTHVLVMEPARFRTFECDPLNVEAAARGGISCDLPPSPPTRLSPLLLTDATGRQPASTAAPQAADAEPAVHVLSTVLQGRRLLAVGAPAPQKVLRWVLGATPIAVRERLSLSYGLKFSPSRGFQLVLTDADHRETQRIARDHNIDFFCWETPPTPASSAFDAWLRFVRQHWESGRHADLDRLSTQLTEENSAQALEQIATLSTDIERVKQADALLLDRLIQRYSRITLVSETHARLLGDFRKTAELRKQVLMSTEQESDPEDELPVVGLA